MRKPPRRTRERILALALRLFNEFGEPNVTTTMIADEINISPGNLYYHFRNKDEITHSILDQFDRDIDALFDLTRRPNTNVEDAWLFLHMLFELIWRYRFLYRDLNDLITRNRRIELLFKSVVQRKTSAALALCQGLAQAGSIHADQRQLSALATNMALVATYWLSFEYLSHARRFNDAAMQSQAAARGAYHVLALTAPYLSGDERALFDRLASQYIDTGGP